MGTLTLMAGTWVSVVAEVGALEAGVGVVIVQLQIYDRQVPGLLGGDGILSGSQGGVFAFRHGQPIVQLAFQCFEVYLVAQFGEGAFTL
jgi:hypothetical protein